MFFPLILGTFFFMAFSKISSQTETFSTINVAVCADDTDDTAYFKEVIENLYADDRKEVPFFNITYTDRESADKLLSDKKADGIITVDNGKSFPFNTRKRNRRNRKSNLSLIPISEIWL